MMVVFIMLNLPEFLPEFGQKETKSSKFISSYFDHDERENSDVFESILLRSWQPMA